MTKTEVIIKFLRKKKSNIIYVVKNRKNAAIFLQDHNVFCKGDWKILF